MQQRIPKGQFDALDEILDEWEIQNLRTQTRLNKLIEERFFPGKEMTAGSITVFAPRGGGSRSTSSTGEFEIESKRLTGEFSAVYKGKNLLVNGEDHGPLKNGDVVDFRMPDKVFVNDVERPPVVK